MTYFLLQQLFQPSPFANLPNCQAANWVRLVLISLIRSISRSMCPLCVYVSITFFMAPKIISWVSCRLVMHWGPSLMRMSDTRKRIRSRNVVIKSIITVEPKTESDIGLVPTRHCLLLQTSSKSGCQVLAAAWNNVPRCWNSTTGIVFFLV